MQISIHYDHITGPIKPMNAVNNGPVYRPGSEQNTGNLDTYTDANIPFARTHDSSFYSGYGGEHTVDVHLIFTDFAADPYDPASYDFFYTDKYMQAIELAGTGVFYRFGAHIEHGQKKYGTHPPKDFHKWAVICEHIIRHYNEGWAEGFHMGIQYWEIWNEPDGAPNWTGTPEQFYDLYAIASRHLRECFPDIKIGGPALAFDDTWMENFLVRVKKDNLPLDYFSWHAYPQAMDGFRYLARKRREQLDKHGFTDTESYLNEWNYVCGWTGDGWTKSLETEISMKGAAFIAGAMTVCQTEPVDMLMYYDARPCVMNGLFNFYSFKPLKSYYSIKTWGEMLKMGNACEALSDIPDVYAVAASGEENKMTMVTYYTNEEVAYPKTFQVALSGMEDRELSLYLLDENHDMEKVGLVYPHGGLFTLTMEPNTVVVIR